MRHALLVGAHLAKCYSWFMEISQAMAMAAPACLGLGFGLTLDTTTVDVIATQLSKSSPVYT